MRISKAKVSQVEERGVKVPKVGRCLMCMRKSKVANAAGAE